MMSKLPVALALFKVGWANSSDSSSFSLDEATKFARLAQVSYCDESDDVKNWNCKGCVESKIPVVPGSVQILRGDTEYSTQLVLGKMSDKPGCFIAFRGSSNVQNWIRDFQLQPDHAKDSDCDGCTVHSGYKQIWLKLEDWTVKTLKEVGCDGSDKMLYMTGHSLGAGVATLAALNLHNQGFKIGRMYTFESPRVGNLAYANYWHSKLGNDIQNFRVTHHKDPVVHGPTLSQYYNHVNTEVYFKNADGNEYKVCTKNEDPDCADKWGSSLPLLLFYASEHCANDAFGKDFNFCAGGTDACSAAVVVV